MRGLLLLAMLLVAADPAAACNCQAPASAAVQNTYLGITVLLGGIPLLALTATFAWLLRRES